MKNSSARKYIFSVITKNKTLKAGTKERIIYFWYENIEALKSSRGR